MRGLLLALTLMLSAPAEAQTVVVNTEAEQYLQYTAMADSVVENVIMRAQDMSLVDWQIVVTFEDLPTTSGIHVTARTSASPAYYTARIVFDLEAIGNLGDWLRDEVIVHELAHVMSWEFVDLLLQAERTDSALIPTLYRASEQLATRIARMYVWRRCGGR